MTVTATRSLTRSISKQLTRSVHFSTSNNNNNRPNRQSTFPLPLRITRQQINPRANPFTQRAIYSSSTNVYQYHARAPNIQKDRSKNRSLCPETFSQAIDQPNHQPNHQVANEINLRKDLQPAETTSTGPDERAFRPPDSKTSALPFNLARQQTGRYLSKHAVF